MTSPPSTDASWQPSRCRRNGGFKIRDESWVKDEPAGHPRSILRTPPLPVDKVLHTTPPATVIHNPLNVKGSKSTREERGLVHWSSSGSSTSTGTSSYNFPLGMDVVRRIHWLRWFPICPTFTGFKVSDEALPPAGEEQGGGEEEVGDVPLPSTKV
ncbi:hypothetical protein ATANTOWER_017062 [Ataeniobius toweri]|uniref:Uncharacterized protein n=1 Tax=Ataeniobius toweri TaxID=208326 RepID=A0ABU7CKI5_9TELE|nr:hypothetical protein [Ataeniobius toweri]